MPKRLRLIEDDGREEFAESNLWKRLAVTEETRHQPQRGAAQLEADQEQLPGDEEQVVTNGRRRPRAQEDDIAATPHEAIESLAAARGEVHLVLDLIKWLIDRNGQEVAVTPITDTRNPVQRLSQLAEDCAVRCGHKQSALSAAGTHLRAGVQALRERCRRENTFYYELAKLQSYWKVQHNPSGSEADFSFDLFLGRTAEKHSTHQPPPRVKVDILKDAMGQVKVSIDKEYRSSWKGTRSRLVDADDTNEDGGSSPQFAIGGHAVHAHLLQQQQEMVWWLLEETLHRQGAKSAHHFNFLQTLTNKLLTKTATTQDPSLAAFEPFLLQHFLSHLFQTPMSNTMVGTPDGNKLLSEVVLWLGHALWGRQHAWREVDKHVANVDNVTLHWQQSWHPCLSVLRICILGSFSGLLMVRGMGLELEGRGQRQDGSAAYFAMQTSHHEISQLMQAMQSGQQHDGDSVVEASSSVVLET
ncbi:unnamed protein product [Ostreobium quekettii]|uniref:Mediator complex subunit 17 n=1 Tax=Ostreobium quekettii TaxID=121088 RepID=A0A8S1IL35_9CHLO|nr:unnamed protein product [Ostreobium quekettii]